MINLKILNFIVFAISLFVFEGSGQSQLQSYPETWNSQWITHPDIDKTAYNHILFRKTIELEHVPNEFIVHVSGDNRYRLYVNEKEVCYGPQLSDTRHWRYESIDLSSFLNKGKNIIAAEVMNWGVERSYGIISFKTGFLMQGNSDREYLINTDYDSSWKVFRNIGMHEKTVYWRGGGDIVGGFYAANPTDSVNASDYPWGWKSMDFNDDDWKSPEVIFAQPKTNAGAGHGWILQPRTTPIQVNSKESLDNIVRHSLKSLSKNFSFGIEPLLIPANQHHTLLIDKKYVTLGYPKLTMSKGKDAVITVKYSEALYNEQNHKGNRNVIEGKEIKGISDVYVMDGGEKRTFQPIWFRTFRFVELDIRTGNEPLQINDFFNVFSASPVKFTGSFVTSNKNYDRVWDICAHGLKICAQDNLLSDAYYEQMQYVGDLRPHLKAWTALTGDLVYFRSAMEQFNNSRLPDGNITSCYPLKATFVHPTYSLIWIDMLHDLMMLEGDKSYIEQYVGEIQEVFDYYESIINAHGMVGKSEYHMFVDWYLPKGGNSAVNKDGNAAILTLNYAYTLANAAEIMDWLGYREKAMFYRIQAKKYSEIVRKLCFDEDKGIYADDPEKTFYDQRASILAVLTDAHSDDESKALIEKILDKNTHFDSYANLFYYFYLFEAMQKTGMGNFTEVIQPWVDIAEMGMSATPEKRIEQHPRSEVHPWTAHPVHYYFAVVAGIKPVSPGFASVQIAPNPGDLEFVSASYPVKQGKIEVNLQFSENSEAIGTITLPVGISGSFIWKDKIQPIQSGANRIVL